MKPTNKAKSIIQSVPTRKATPEELERISKLKPPTDRFGKSLRRTTIQKEE